MKKAIIAISIVCIFLLSSFSVVGMNTEHNEQTTKSNNACWPYFVSGILAFLGGTPQVGAALMFAYCMCLLFGYHPDTACPLCS